MSENDTVVITYYNFMYFEILIYFIGENQHYFFQNSYEFRIIASIYDNTFHIIYTKHIT